MRDKNTSINVPILNRVLAVFVALMTIAFFFAGLAAGVMAAFGESFFYSDIIIKLFPYSDFPNLPSFFDTFRGLARFLAGVFPALIVMAISHLMIKYLTEGGKSALGNLADIRKGFLYQLTHPFSNPGTPMNSSEEESSASELQAHRDLFKSIYQYTGSYPVWKVQQEFRELVLELNPGIDHCHFHFHNLDAYLSKLVDEVDKLRKFHDSHYSLGHGWDNLLPQARGDHLLPKIIAKHNEFKKPL